MRRRSPFGRLDERRVRWLLAAFFAALAVPAALLVAQAYRQLEWEAFRNSELLAEDLVERIDADLRARVAAEETRSFGDYSFLVVEGDAATNFVQRSPLSAYPVTSALPGALGYFQVDAVGVLTTPLLPPAGVDTAAYGIAPDEAAARRTLERTIRDVLAENRLVERRPSAAAAASFYEDSGAPADDAAAPLAEGAGAPSEPAAAPAERAELRPQGVADVAANAVEAGGPAAAAQTQAAFDRLTSSRALQRRMQAEPATAAEADKTESAAAASVPASASADEAERPKRTEQVLVPEQQGRAAREGIAAEFRIRTFESELEPFELGLLDTGHMVLFRNAWRDGQRYIQGVLLDRAAFVTGSIESAYRSSAVAASSVLQASYRGEPLASLAAQASAYDSRELTGTPLHRARLSPPFGDLELELRATSLPRPPGTVLLAWVSVTLAALLLGGFFFMYRFAVGQIRLTRQQQDFVSAVSHELKTPLTSIRMYGEMLKAGWADDAKKQTYYDYIHTESERLSRLIENVLQLARLTRSSQRFDLKRVGVGELLDMARSKVATQVERAGFVLDVRNDAPAGTEITVDADCFAQIVINLVDNALKFAAAAERKTVEIACRRESDGKVLFTVRDYGPGIPKGQMKKIFELFYRPANELTRETVGTGIGLALVRELATAMGGRVDVRNCEPGAEFRISFPAS